MIDLSQAPTVIASFGLVLLWGVETRWPSIAKRKGRLRHAVRNLSLGLMNALVTALIASPLIVYAGRWAESHSVGLLHVANLPASVSFPLSFLLLDGWMYLWHRANHRIPLLWRFHRVHHSDMALDVTSAIRFHTGEIILSSILRLMLIPLLGVSLWQIVLYDALLLPVIQFHHSNVKFPERFDRWLRLFIASPAMHRVHHSRLQAETDSNYASVFSFWDRLGQTFRLRRDTENIQFGLEEYDKEQWQQIGGLLRIPFTPTPRGKRQGQAISQ